MLEIIAVVIASAALLVALAAVAIAADRKQPQGYAPPTREERIARARADIAACKIAEMTLEDHHGDLPALLILAHRRADAAAAQVILKSLDAAP